jgi:hypothetical protein
MAHMPNSRRVVNLTEALVSFTEHWSPRIIAELSGRHVKPAESHGKSVSRHHEGSDQLFLVVRLGAAWSAAGN